MCYRVTSSWWRRMRQNGTRSVSAASASAAVVDQDFTRAEHTRPLRRRITNGWLVDSHLATGVRGTLLLVHRRLFCTRRYNTPTTRFLLFFFYFSILYFIIYQYGLYDWRRLVPPIFFSIDHHRVYTLTRITDEWSVCHLPRGPLGSYVIGRRTRRLWIAWNDKWWLDPNDCR